MKSVTYLLDEYTHLQIRGGSRNLSGQSNKSLSACQCWGSWRVCVDLASREHDGNQRS
jgi:hypothetical protein